MVPGLYDCVSDEFGVDVRVAICSTYKLGLCSAVTENLPPRLIQLRVSFHIRSLKSPGLFSNCMALSVQLCCVSFVCGFPLLWGF